MARALPTTMAAGSYGRIHSRTLAAIRWVAVAGQAAALLVVHFGLGYPLPLGPALAAVCASVLVNLVIAIRRPAGTSLTEQAAARYLAYDIVQLAVLLYLTGGLENPFAFLLLAPVAVSATVLSLFSTVALCVLTLVCVTALAVWHLPLPWSGPPPQLPITYVLGVWVALVVGILFFAAYTCRVAEEARRLSDGLAATQLALAREQQVSALGALAAAAAHELGSPLGTIAIAAREIERELAEGSTIGEDVSLVISETDRCRKILAEFAHNSGNDSGMPFSRLPIGAVVEQAASRHMRDGVEIILDARPFPESSLSAAPSAPASAEIIQGIGNLIQNALQFARTEVRVSTRWDGATVQVTIGDDGPGFPQMVLERLGEPYLSVRHGGGDHMGLGIFIAQTLLQRAGGMLTFRNRDSARGVTGAQVTVSWERKVLEEAGGPPAGIGAS
jgi:two-component system sensor histidine kinase RegB